VDNRLFNIETRPGQLRRQDLPLVARALVAAFRRRALVKVGRIRDLGYVRIEAPGYHVQILESDWSKILPYIQDGTFNQFLFKSQVDSVWLDPNTQHASSIIDFTDKQYYLKVLGILQGLFPVAYPTSP